MIIEVVQQATQNLKDFAEEIAKELETGWLLDPAKDKDWTPEYIAVYNDGVRGAANAIRVMVDEEL